MWYLHSFMMPQRYMVYGGLQFYFRMKYSCMSYIFWNLCQRVVLGRQAHPQETSLKMKLYWLWEESSKLAHTAGRLKSKRFAFLPIKSYSNPCKQIMWNFGQNIETILWRQIKRYLFKSVEWKKCKHAEREERKKKMSSKSSTLHKADLTECK